MVRDSANTHAARKQRAGSSLITPADEAALIPYCVYLYYITRKTADEPAIEVFVYDHRGPIQDIGSTIKDIVPKAVHGTLSAAGYGVGDLRWRRKSYLVFALHDDSRKFLNEKGVGIEDRDWTLGPSTLIEFPATDRSGRQVTVHAIFCKNHVRKKDGTPWQEGVDGPEPHKVHLMPDIPYHHAFRGHEDTGQNLGPPVPPP